LLSSFCERGRLDLAVCVSSVARCSGSWTGLAHHRLTCLCRYKGISPTLFSGGPYVGLQMSFYEVCGQTSADTQGCFTSTLLNDPSCAVVSSRIPQGPRNREGKPVLEAGRGRLSWCLCTGGQCCTSSCGCDNLFGMINSSACCAGHYLSVRHRQEEDANERYAFCGVPRVWTCSYLKPYSQAWAGGRRST